MSNPILKLTALALFALALGLAPTAARAQDDAAAKSPPATGPSAHSDSGKSDSGKSDSAAPGPAKFYGNITAVDTKANTFTVDNQTYNIVPESQVTKAGDEGKAATITDAVVGEPARGTYTKTADGKMNVTKVRFGKKTGGKSGGGKGGKKKDDAGATTNKTDGGPTDTKSDAGTSTKSDGQ